MKLTLVLVISVLFSDVYAVSTTPTPTSPSSTAIENDASALLDPNVKIDPKLRKALLRVLTDLENQDDNNSDESSESTSPGELKKIFNVHAFSADTSNQITDVSLLVPKASDSTESSKTVTVTGKPFSKSSSKNEIPKEPSKFFVTPHETIKAPAPTAETSFQSDEANAKVEEVQFFPAPLVAAFTVHQDAQGLPRSVIPLYKEDERKTNEKIVDAKGLFQRVAPLLSENKGTKKVESQSNNKSQDTSLEEKQRLLEEQYKILQEQQRQQEQFLRQQQFYHEQQILAGRQRQQELEDQRRIQQLRFEEEKRRQQSFKNAQSFRPNTIVSLLPSISLQQPPQINNQQTFNNVNPNFPASFFNQQLPNREAVDFLTNLRLQNLHELPLQQNHIPLNFDQALPPQQQINFLPQSSSGTRNFRQEIGTGNFGLNQPTFQAQISPIVDFASSQQQPQTIRNFRHEFGTGNFGLNQQPSLSSFHSQISPVFDLTGSTTSRNLNRNLRQETNTANAGINRSNLQSFINNDPIILSQVGGSSNRVFRQPNNNFALERQNQIYTADRQLKNLLYQSGIVQGRNEDLNIVSKVLSLNHFGGDLSGEIRRSDRGTTFYFKNNTPIKHQIEEKQKRQTEEKNKNIQLQQQRSATLNSKPPSVKNTAVVRNFKTVFEESDDVDYYCIFCTEKYESPPKEDWIMCKKCKKWAHDQCTSGQYASYDYVCDLC